MQFLSIVSHEIHTPMNGVIGKSTLIYSLNMFLDKYFLKIDLNLLVFLAAMFSFYFSNCLFHCGLEALIKFFKIWNHAINVLDGKWVQYLTLIFFLTNF